MSENRKLPRVGSAVLVVADDRVLLGARAKDPNRGKWVLPGGKIEPFESIEAAAKREIKEETGLEIELDGPVTVREIIKLPDEHRVIIFSHARPVGGALKAGSDLSDVRFFSSSQLSGLDISDAVAEVLDDFGWFEAQPLAA